MNSRMLAALHQILSTLLINSLAISLLFIGFGVYLTEHSSFSVLNKFFFLSNKTES